MRLRTFLLVALLATATVVGAHVAPRTAGPLRLALQRSDVPATVEGSLLGPAKPEEESSADLSVLGADLKGADYSYTSPAGGNVPGLGAVPKEWHLAGEVLVTPSIVAEKKLFADGKAAQHGFFGDFGPEGASRVSLPSYGDEQFGLIATDAGGPQAMLFVRRSTVVWELRAGHSPPKWTVTRAHVVGLLTTYARKQQTRVGAG